VVSYSPEYGPRSANPDLLADLAALTGGQVAPSAETLFVAPGQRVGQVREVALPLLWLALILLPLDIALRRLFLRNSDLRLPRPVARPAPTAAEPDPALARLQAARERARRTAGAQGRPDRAPPAERASEPASRPAPPPSGAPVAQPTPAPLDEERLAALLTRKRRRDGEG
jgi:hypothetical protein